MEEKIIDGVDVSKCDYFIDKHTNFTDKKIDIKKGYCYADNSQCKGTNCYYKQLQKAKKYIKDLETENKDFANQINENNEKYYKLENEKYKLLDKNVKLKQKCEYILKEKELLESENK